MTRFTASIGCLLIAIIFLSCENEKVVDGARKVDSTSKLYGRWIWVKSTGGIAGSTVTPQTEGFKRSLSFSKEGRAIWYKNGTSEDTIDFNVGKGTSIFRTGLADLITYDDNRIRQSFELKGCFSINNLGDGDCDSLVLNDECFDCYSHLYVKNVVLF